MTASQDRISKNVATVLMIMARFKFKFRSKIISLCPAKGYPLPLCISTLRMAPQGPRLLPKPNSVKDLDTVIAAVSPEAQERLSSAPAYCRQPQAEINAFSQNQHIADLVTEGLDHVRKRLNMHPRAKGATVFLSSCALERCNPSQWPQTCDFGLSSINFRPAVSASAVRIENYKSNYI